ncbi:hypothetical protein KFE98_01440 [bacterium SCSIO 12741]|nr:hypothetical protein KFE98_01440 [bacterium SCSIO 12741]
MEKWICILVFLTTGLSCFGQDTIYLRDKKHKPIYCHIQDTNAFYIRFKKMNKPDGRTYSVTTDDVLVIADDNGHSWYVIKGRRPYSYKRYDREQYLKRREEKKAQKRQEKDSEFVEP